MAHYRILIVEDDPNTSAFVSQILEEGGYVVSGAETVAGARRKIKAASFDMLIIDRTLPDGDGLDLCAELRRKPTLKALPVLFLTAKQSVEDRVEGLRTGGDDYLTKPFEAPELLARIEAVLRRTGQLGQPEVIEAGPFKLDFESRKAFVKDESVPLWAKEFDLLALLMSHKGRVLSRDFLLQQLWGYGAADKPATKVVDITISHLRDKLGSHGDKVVTVRGFGYRLDV